MSFLKRIMPAVIGVGLCAGAAHADYYINWRVDNPGGFTYDYAQVAVSSTGYSGYLTAVGDVEVTEFDASMVNAFAGDSLGLQGRGAGDGDSSYNFKVELWSDTEGLLAESDIASWGELVNNWRCVNANVMGVTGEGVWVAGNFKAIPEPTSGMLLLLGIAGLALRRKFA